MNRNIPVQVAYDRTNKGVDIRNPSTANFLIDSQDRAGYNASTVFDLANFAPTSASADFTITKPGQNLISGFFTRLAMTEIVLNWNIFNISEALGNNTTGVALISTSTGATTLFPNISITQGNYTVKTALDALVASMNLNMTPQNLFSVTSNTPVGLAVAGKKGIVVAGPWKFSFYRTTPVPASPAPFVPNLAQALGFITWDSTNPPFGPGVHQTILTAYKPNLLAYNYIDITSPQLASQQKVKDSTTSAFDSIDVIYRWVFANDEADPSVVDEYGYPILQGYLPFTSRRYIAFPKQVRWDPLLPIGNLQFQTYTDQETILQYNGVGESFEFKMLMLISEV
jgi:hypothetical protein